MGTFTGSCRCKPIGVHGLGGWGHWAPKNSTLLLGWTLKISVTWAQPASLFSPVNPLMHLTLRQLILPDAPRMPYPPLCPSLLLCSLSLFLHPPQLSPRAQPSPPSPDASSLPSSLQTAPVVRLSLCPPPVPGSSLGNHAPS